MEQLRGGEGPIFAEVSTYRTCGHVGIDSDEWLAYRTPEEIATWKQRDPLPLMRELVLAAGTEPAVLEAMETEIEDRIETAIDAAKAAPHPEFDQVLSWNMDPGFHPLVTHLIEGPVSTFDPRQVESRLKAY